MLSDLLVQMLLVGDFKSAMAKQGYLHHFLAIIGAVGGISIGRFIATLSSVTGVTEITTPCVNNRYMLHIHGK